MTLWLFKTNWFENKTKADILEYLPDRKISEISGDTVSYSVKFTKAEMLDIDYIQEDLGILTITFENNKVIKAEYKERKNTDLDYAVKKEWNK